MKPIRAYGIREGRYYYGHTFQAVFFSKDTADTFAANANAKLNDSNTKPRLKYSQYTVVPIHVIRSSAGWHRVNCTTLKIEDAKPLAVEQPTYAIKPPVAVAPVFFYGATPSKHGVIP